MKYYANILTPFSGFVAKKIKEFVALGLPLDMICTSHGVVWRDNPLQIVTRYAQWAADYQENQITVIYDTMWNGTRRMAEAIAQGIAEADGTVLVKIYNAARADKNDIITEVFRSKADPGRLPHHQPGAAFRHRRHPGRDPGHGVQEQEGRGLWGLRLERRIGKNDNGAAERGWLHPCQRGVEGAFGLPMSRVWQNVLLSAETLRCR